MAHGPSGSACRTGFPAPGVANRRKRLGVGRRRSGSFVKDQGRFHGPDGSLPSDSPCPGLECPPVARTEVRLAQGLAAIARALAGVEATLAVHRPPSLLDDARRP